MRSHFPVLEKMVVGKSSNKLMLRTRGSRGRVFHIVVKTDAYSLYFDAIEPHHEKTGVLSMQKQ